MDSDNTRSLDDKFGNTNISSENKTNSPSQLRGFSSNISDPAFAKYQKNSRSWSFLFSSILAVIAIMGFPIYGNASREIDWPESLFYGMGIGAMFIAIAGMQTLKRKMDKTWDGTVIDKQYYRKRQRTNLSIVYRTEYIIKIKKDSGGTKINKWIDSPGLFNYYSVGDRVRHHKGFFYYEKYDKSIDLQILCAACNSFNDITQDICSRCKCPLLK